MLIFLNNVSLVITDSIFFSDAITLQDDDEVPQIEDNSEEDVSHLRDGSVVVSEGRFSVVDVAGMSAVAVDKDDQEFEIRCKSYLLSSVIQSDK